MADQEIKDAIKSLLEVSNRPYNGNNLVDEMSARFKKAMIVKALQALEDAEEIQVKTFGKVRIYLADQRIFPVPNDEELAALDAEIDAKAQEEQVLKVEVAKLQGTADSLEAQPTNAALEANLKELTETVKKLKRQVAQCSSSSSSGAPSDGMDKKTLEKTLGATETNLKKRKRICSSLLQDLEAQSGIARDTLYDMVGIEAD